MLPQHFNYRCYSRSAIGRLLDNLCQYNLSVLGFRGIVNNNFTGNAFVVGLKNCNTATDLQSANQSFYSTFQHFDHSTFLTTFAIRTCDLHNNTITIHYRTHLTCGEKNIFTTCFIY